MAAPMKTYRIQAKVTHPLMTEAQLVTLPKVSSNEPTSRLREAAVEHLESKGYRVLKTSITPITEIN